MASGMEISAPTDHELLQLAIGEAQQGLSEGGIPIGAALVRGTEVLGTGRNRRVQDSSTIRHGEMDALEAAGRQPARVYASATMYTTLSPCNMCAGAILLYRIPRVVIGENRTFMGAEDLLRNRGVEVINLDVGACVDLMTKFIEMHPSLWREDIGVDDTSELTADNL